MKLSLRLTATIQRANKLPFYYDSKDPDLAVLVPGAGDLILIDWSYAGTAAFCCAVSLFFLIRRKRGISLT
jgi:hypothetical protein